MHALYATYVWPEILQNRLYVMWASKQEILYSVFENNKGADKPVHPSSLISTFVIRLLESIINRIFNYLASLCS